MWIANCLIHNKTFVYNYVQIIVQEVRKVQTRRLHMKSKKGIVGTTVAQKSVPMLCHFEKIRELWDIKKESGKALAGWMKVLALGIPTLLWSCDLVAMEARSRYFKMPVSCLHGNQVS